MKTPIVFEFDFSGGDRLGVDQIWPDGDAPKKPTVQDVLNKIVKTCGGECNGRKWGMKDQFMDKWNLCSYLEITITGPGGSVEVP